MDLATKNPLGKGIHDNYIRFWEHGFIVFPLHKIVNGKCPCGCASPGKHPLRKNWQHTAHDEPIDSEYTTGYGILVTNGLMVIDVDARNGGVESYAKLVNDYPEIAGCGLIVATGSGNGSKHLFFKSSAKSLKSKLDKYPGIDFKSSGFVVGAGSLHASGNTYDILVGDPGDIGEAPPGIIGMLMRENDHDTSIRSSPNNSGYWDKEEIEQALSFLDPNCAYDQWVGYGMALHHELGDDGFALWDKWSSSASRTSEKGKSIYPGSSELGKRWQSFSTGKSNLITINSLIYDAKLAGWEEPDIDLVFSNQKKSDQEDDGDIIIATNPANLKVEPETLLWLMDKALSRAVKEKGLNPPAEFKRDGLLHRYDDYQGTWYQFDKLKGFSAIFGINDTRYAYPDAKICKSLVEACSLMPFPISGHEWNHSELAPKCIVEDYIYADLRLLVGSGGVGKTTLMLYEAARIALGIDLYGNKIVSPGNVIIVTAEDKRERLIARLREITNVNFPDDEKVNKLMHSIFILDMTSKVRSLLEVKNDVVIVNYKHVDNLIDEFKSIDPVLVIFDPAVSFGVGETRVNDAMQGLVTAARRIISALDCCLTFIHHTGKANATNSASAKESVYKTVQDQYISRSGSALADGARMIHNIGAPSLKDFKRMTGGGICNKGSFFEYEAPAGLFLGLAKMSYAKPRHPVIAIARDGYRFQHLPIVLGEAVEPEKINQKILEFLGNEVKKGEKHSLKSLIKSIHTSGLLGKLSRDKTEEAIKKLIGDGMIVERPLDKPQGAKKTYLDCSNIDRTK